MRKGVSSPEVRGHAARVPDLEFPHPLISVTFDLATTDRHCGVRLSQSLCRTYARGEADVVAGVNLSPRSQIPPRTPTLGLRTAIRRTDCRS